MKYLKIRIIHDQMVIKLMKTPSHYRTKTLKQTSSHNFSRFTHIQFNNHPAQQNIYVKYNKSISSLISIHTFLGFFFLGFYFLKKNHVS